jgi:transposase InsO family protein
VVDALGKQKIFTTLDLATGYWSIPLDPETSHKTTFMTTEGSYSFKRLPFGLKHAPAIFQRMMDMTLAGLKWHTCLTYIDDIIIFSRTEEEHLKKLETVLGRLAAANLSVKLPKCSFFQEKVIYLGHVVSAEGVQPDPEKVRAIVEMELPGTLSRLESWLGMAGYYKKYIANYSSKVGPIRKLMDPLVRKRLKKKERGRKARERVVWTEKAQRRWTDLLAELAANPMLAHPDFSLPFLVATDAASTHGLGAVISQIIEGKERPIMFASRPLSRAELKWHIREQEALAIVWACEVFRPYVWGRKFSVQTDHQSLQWLHQVTKPGRLSRWSLRLQEFDFDIQYRKGAQHANADGPSRNPVATDQGREDRLVEEREERMHPEVLFGEMSAPLEQMGKDQRMDEKIGPMIEYLATGQVRASISRFARIRAQFRDDGGKRDTEAPFVTGNAAGLEPEEQERARVLEKAFRSDRAGLKEKFFLKNGVLYRMKKGGGDVQDGRLVIPKSRRGEFLRSFHEEPLAGHQGVRKMIKALGQRVWWRGMTSDVKKWVRSCHWCQKRKSRAPRGHGLYQCKFATRPGQVWSMDLSGRLPKTAGGYEYILVVVDCFTRYMELIPVRSKDAKVVARALVNRVFCRHGIPRALYSDEGGEFDNNLMKRMQEILHLKQHFTAIYHPDANGQVERLNGLVLEMLTMYVNRNRKDWHLWLPTVAFAHNAGSRIAGHTPFGVMHGREPEVPADIWYRPVRTTNGSVDLYVEKVAQQLHDTYRIVQRSKLAGAMEMDQSGRKHVEYEDGQQVLVLFPRRSLGSGGKLQCQWSGPRRVLRQVGAYSYIVKNVTGKEARVHVTRMRKYEARDENLAGAGEVVDMSRKEIEEAFDLAPGILQGAEPEETLWWREGQGEEGKEKSEEGGEGDEDPEDGQEREGGGRARMGKEEKGKRESEREAVKKVEQWEGKERKKRDKAKKEEEDRKQVRTAIRVGEVWGKENEEISTEIARVLAWDAPGRRVKVAYQTYILSEGDVGRYREEIRRTRKMKKEPGYRAVWFKNQWLEMESVTEEVRREGRELHARLEEQRKKAQQKVQRRRQKEPRYQVAFDSFTSTEEDKQAWEFEGGVVSRGDKGVVVQLPPSWMKKEAIRAPVWAVWRGRDTE